MIHLALTLTLMLAIHTTPPKPKPTAVIVLPPRVAAAFGVGQVLTLPLSSFRFAPNATHICLDGKCVDATPLEMEQIWLAYAMARGERPVTCAPVGHRCSR